MFYLSYVLAELRRRPGRTILTALGLAIGVMLVVVVNALSTGLNTAQATVLKPLTGLGTDMTVTRPLVFSTSGGNPFASLTPSQRQQLRGEAGPGRFGFQNLGKPGSHFTSDRFSVGGQLTIPASQVKNVSKLSGVLAAAGTLTLRDVTISGTVPKTTASSGSSASGQGFGFPGARNPGGGFGGQGAPGQGFAGPRNINFNSRTVTGVDWTQPDLASVTPTQITAGTYFSTHAGANAAILSTSYANSNGIRVGSSITLGKKTFHVIGLAAAPLGGTSSDIYVPLATLQTLSGYSGQVNALQVRASTGSAVTTVKQEVTSSLKGAQVTTAADLAKRVGGSLSDAQNLSNQLGRALEIVGLLAAIAIACLLTLTSVTKRVREIGTLRAIGWSRALVVRQIGLETLTQGAMGGVLGIVLGFLATRVIDAAGWTLSATVPGPSSPTAAGFGGGGFGGFGFGRFAQSTVNAGSTLVKITAPVNLSLILLAVVLAVVGGVVAGVIGGLRAAQLRPASALRSVE